MSLWATRRQFIYLSIIFIPIFVFVFLFLFFFYYEEPTCFDGKQNGDEVGIDCGGSCNLLCESQIIEPIVLWERSFEVAPGVYNATAFIENPNVNAVAYDVSYTFELFNDKNLKIAESSGLVKIPKNQKFAIFEGPISTRKEKVSRTVFKFEKEPVWYRETGNNLNISISDEVLKDSDSKPKLTATVKNNSPENISNIEFIALVSDFSGKVIHTSRTFLDSLESRSSKQIFFTWPNSFDAGVSICAEPTDSILVIDRSGSMDDDNENPPQPLTDVKNAAISFLNRLQGGDKTGLVSFATEASIDHLLTEDIEKVKESVGEISIKTENVQHTNIADGLKQATEEIISERSQINSDKIIILLTDGIASRPLMDGNEDYPNESALEEADLAKSLGVEVYAIGLGSAVEDDFLKNLASTPSHYYFAPTSVEVEKIYQSIATAICDRLPTTIQIIPRLAN